MPVYIIGVSGATCSGKTQMCSRLKASGKYKCSLVSMDHHYYLYNSDKHIRLPEFDNYANYEDVASVDWDSLCDAVRAAAAQLKADGPPDEIKLLLIEGILVLNSPAVDQLCHRRIFIRLDDRDEFLRRRSQRVYEEDPVPDGYDVTVTWPMYVKNSAALAGRSDIAFLNGADTPDALFEQFSALVEAWCPLAA